MIKFLALFISILFILPVHSKSEGIQLEGKKLGKFPFRVLGSGKYQNLNFASKDKDTVNPRHLNGFGAEALGGLVLGSVLIGGGGEYMNWVQATDPVDNSDLSGTSLNIFGAIGVGFNRFLIIGKYIFQSTYSVSKKDTNGDKTKYYQPSGGYAATLVYRIGKRGFINTEFNSLTYGKKSVGSTKTSLNSDEKMIFQSIAFGFGIMI